MAKQKPPTRKPKMTVAQDKAMDKRMGIKPGSAADRKMDRKMGIRDRD